MDIHEEAVVRRFGADAAVAGDVHPGAGGEAGGFRWLWDNPLGTGQQGQTDGDGDGEDWKSTGDWLLCKENQIHRNWRWKI